MFVYTSITDRCMGCRRTIVDVQINLPAVNVSSREATSTRWWRTSLISSSDGLLHPMKTSLYTCTESHDTISPPRSLQRASAMDDFPVAVGPVRIKHNMRCSLLYVGEAVARRRVLPQGIEWGEGEANTRPLSSAGVTPRIGYR